MGRIKDVKLQYNRKDHSWEDLIKMFNGKREQNIAAVTWRESWMSFLFYRWNYLSCQDSCQIVFSAKVENLLKIIQVSEIYLKFPFYT